ncbi:peptide ABC transporter permease [Brachybacterium endophyticum]|uniref:Peptide ABC transporter permease n=1 Tax=Brachybacterium endophyticum TaxID=2182385 RepID=A0A2U2RKN4_9MICO|nr:ABC transporter permease [Brachybacterium endophyticum]PWH06344.1 peptide ABC transporter permease [Brachybacterium endophyticum]
MLRYVLRRLGQAVVVLWGAITLSFVIVQLTPGDPARLIVMGNGQGDAGAADASQLAQIRDEMGLDQPLVLQYLGYLRRVLTLDWGTAYSRQRQAVATVIGDSLGSTLELGLVSLVLLVLLGVAFALGSVLLPTAWARSTFQAVTVVGIAVPSFVMAILLLQIFSFRLGWFPAFGADGPGSIVLPSLTIALLGAGTLGQVFSRSIREVSAEGYVEVARARGLGNAQVVLSHVLRNASLPVYTIIGMLVGGVVSGAAIIETIFGRPGIGNLYVEAVTARDFPLIQALIVLTGGLYVLVTLVVDLSYPLIDPRVVSPAARGGRR